MYCVALGTIICIVRGLSLSLSIYIYIYMWLGGRSPCIASHDTWHELSGSSSEASTNVLCTQ